MKIAIVPHLLFTLAVIMFPSFLKRLWVEFTALSTAFCVLCATALLLFKLLIPHAFALVDRFILYWMDVNEHSVWLGWQVTFMSLMKVALYPLSGIVVMFCTMLTWAWWRKNYLCD